MVNTPHNQENLRQKSSFEQLKEHHYQPLNVTIAGIKENTNSSGYIAYRCAVSAAALDYVPFAYIVGLDKTPGHLLNHPLSAIFTAVSFFTCVIGNHARSFALTTDATNEEQADYLVALGSLQTGAKYALRAAAMNAYQQKAQDLPLLGLKAVKGVVNGAAYNYLLPQGLVGISIYGAPLIEAFDNAVNILQNLRKPSSDYNFRSDVTCGFTVGTYLALAIHYGGFTLARNAYNNVVESVGSSFDKITGDAIFLSNLLSDAALATKELTDQVINNMIEQYHHYNSYTAAPTAGKAPNTVETTGNSAEKVDEDLL